MKSRGYDQREGGREGGEGERERENFIFWCLYKIQDRVGKYTARYIRISPEMSTRVGDLFA
jgi:hypothetical protein